MAVRTIIQSEYTGGSELEEKFLRTPAKEVNIINDEIINIIEDLRDTLWHYPFNVGLSAPQIGQPYAISVINSKKESKDEDFIIINPIVISLSGKKDIKHESCMSVWGEMGDVERRYKVTIQYQDIEFNTIQSQFTGFESRIIQHEIDHLNGILFIDKLLPESKLQHANFFDEYSILHG